MNRRNCVCISALAAMGAMALFGQAPASATVSKPAKEPAPAKIPARKWTAPHTADGQPDLQGVWTNSTLTPMERPAELAGRDHFASKQEADDYAKKTFANITGDRRDGGAQADVGRSYNEYWRDRGNSVIGSLRTSLITDPPDGKVPALTAAAQKKIADAQAYQRAHATDSAQNRNLWERCLTRGLPIVPGPYNNDFEIVQSPGYVAIVHEMIHDARVIPLDGRPHVAGAVRQWFGDPRGHWEGDTLVVDSTNFNEQTNFRGASEGLHLIERFTRVDPETISYQFTVDDPSTFTKPWSAEIPMIKTPDQVFEYACNEGNYALRGILAGARADEAKAAGITGTAGATTGAGAR